jgi:hypothetical protein
MNKIKQFIHESVLLIRLGYQIDPNESSSRQSAEFLSDSENNVDS